VKTVMPRVALEHDSPSHAMALHPELKGFSRARAVWLFGFPRGSVMAEAFRVWTDAPLWALTVHSGTVLELFTAPWDATVPVRFSNVIVMRLEA